MTEPGGKPGIDKRLLRAVLILPGSVLVVVPGAILLATLGSTFSWEVSGPVRLQFWPALLLLAVGLWLMIGTMRLFLKVGEGTPAPWDPPRRFVVEGVYRRVRNPMISGVMMALWAEALVFQSLPLSAWALLFMLGNLIYIPNIEEPGLEKRFGADYRTYKENVPRWLPRPTPWKGSGKGGAA